MTFRTLVVPSAHLRTGCRGTAVLDTSAVAAHQGIARETGCATFMRRTNVRMFASLRGRATQTPFVIDLIVAATACTQFCTFSVRTDITRVNKVAVQVSRNKIR